MKLNSGGLSGRIGSSLAQKQTKYVCEDEEVVPIEVERIGADFGQREHAPTTGFRFVADFSPLYQR